MAKSTSKKAVAVQGGTAEVGGKKFTRKLITTPQLKFVDGKTLYVEITSAFRVSTASGTQVGKDGQKMKPADVCNVINLETGEAATIIVGTVLKNRLEENYPDESYINKKFELTQHKVEGKRWKDYSIVELE
jgi:hypothetical protein